MLYRVDSDHLVPVAETSVTAESLMEADLEGLVERAPDVLGEELLVIGRQVEVDGGRDRLDLLALDLQANLVVIEMKRELIGDDADLQALRYAAMVSGWDHATVRTLAESYWRTTGQERASFTQELDDFCDEGYEVNGAQRLILAGRDVHPRVGTMALWLRRQGLDLRVVSLSLYRDGPSIYLQPQVLIPIPTESDVAARPTPATADKEWLRDGQRWHLEQQLSATGRQLAEQWIGLVERAVPEASGPHWAQKQYIAWRQGSRNWLGCYTDSPHQLAVFIRGLDEEDVPGIAKELGWEAFDAEAGLADKLALGSSVGFDGKGRFFLRIKSDAELTRTSEAIESVLRGAWDAFAGGETKAPAW